jgi:hypothetical protein
VLPRPAPRRFALLAASCVPPASLVELCTLFGWDIFNILDISVRQSGQKVCEVVFGRPAGRVGP